MARERRERTFPTLGFIILLFASLWLFREMDIVDIRLPWIPVILIIISIGMIFDKLAR
jgi:hypothetical protein